MSGGSDAQSAELPVTGHEQIDAALVALAAADHGDLTAQSAALSDLQRTLDSALAEQPNRTT